jgi:tripartite-type tricarboxylate transporter receptor subunit TctC
MTMVVAYAAGGPVDTIARIFGQRLSEVLGQQVVIENIGGAGGMVGASRVAKAPPDGYNFLFGGLSNLAQNQTLYKQPLYNAATDFTPVGLVTDSPRVLIARKDMPANTLPEFIAYAKANKDKTQYGSAGGGSGSHVCALLLDGVIGARITHVPYRGAGPAMQDLIAGRLDYMAEQISTAVQQIDAGTVKGIAILGPDRVPVLPRLQSAKERWCCRSTRPTRSCASSTRRRAKRSTRHWCASAMPASASRSCRRRGGAPSISPNTFPPRSRNGPARSRQAA